MNPTSSTYWLPLVTDAGLPVPRTVSVAYDHMAFIAMISDDEDYPGFPDLVDAVCEAADDIGLPVFIRTDLASAKHDGPPAYLLDVDEPSAARAVLGRTVEDNEIKFWLDPESNPEAILVREFLELDAAFTAFGYRDQPGHPIAREWRIFATAEAVLCSHFYWPENAVEDGRPAEPNWRALLVDLAAQPPPAELNEWAIRAASVCSELPAWSVDFACDTKGQWWLIDMADAAHSWHPEHDEET